MSFPTILRRLSILVFAVTLLAAPWAYGGVLTPTQPWLLLGICIALALFGLSQLGGQSQRQPLPLALVPLSLALLLGILQLVPLPGGVARIVAPHNHQLRTQLTSDAIPSSAANHDSPITNHDSPITNHDSPITNHDSPITNHDSPITNHDSPITNHDSPITNHDSPITNHQAPSPISLRPESTRQDLALLTLAVSTFYLAFGLFTSQRQRIGLLVAVTINGAAFSLFGLIQLLTWNGRHYWIGLTPGGGSPFAAFASRNAAAGYLNLCLAAAFGLIIWTVMRDTTNLAKQQKHGPSDLRGRLLESVASLSALKLLALVLAGLIAGGVVSALSRGGILSMFAAAAVTSLGLAMTRSQRRQLVWFAVAAIAGVGLVFWVGLGSTVEDRLATLSNVEEQTSTGRPPLWKDSIQAVPDFWPMGSGLGTYREVYRQYQHRLDPKWYYHAENQYLEALIDAGVPGLLLMLTMIGLVGLAAFRLLTRSTDLTAYAMGIAGTFALVSQAVHGFFDFGLYLPANFMLLATLSAGVVAAAHQIGLSEDRPAPSQQQTRLRTPDKTGTDSRRTANLSGNDQRVRVPVPLLLARRILCLVLCLACLWGAWEIRAAANQRELLGDTRFAIRPGGTTDSSIATAILELESSLDAHGDLADVHYRLGRLWTLRYRQRKLDQLRRTTPPDVSLDTLWLRTSPTGLHLRAHEASPLELDQLRDEPMGKQYLGPALRHLLKARQSAPLSPMTHLRIGQLCWLYEPLSQDQKHFNRALKLRPSAPNLLIRVGALHFQAGRLEQAANTWQQALVIDDGNVGVHLDAIMTNGVDEDTLVHKVLPGSPGLLLTLANTRFSGPENSGSRQALFARAEDLIDQLKDDDERAYFRGRMLLAQGHPLQATRHYVQAVSGRPNMASWRFELATLLHQQGLVDEARKQARICVQLDPENPHYRALLETLSTK